MTNNDKEMLIKSVERYVYLSKKTMEIEDEISKNNLPDYELNNEYYDAVIKESFQAKVVKRLASCYFKDNEKKWLMFLGCVWSWAQGELSDEKASKTIDEILNQG